MKTLVLNLIGFFVIVTGYSQGSSFLTEFDKANSAYVEGHYDLAIEMYSGILDQGKFSKELYYNLGNSYSKLGKTENAILNYLRGLAIDPNNSAIKEMLKDTREEGGIDIIEISEFWPLRMWKKATLMFSIKSWLIIQVIFGVSILISIFYWRFSKDETRKLRYFVSSVLSLFLFILTIGFGYSSDLSRHNSARAVVMTNTQLKSGADTRSENLRILISGVTLRILDSEIQGWYKVRLRNKDEGWVESEWIEEI